MAKQYTCSDLYDCCDCGGNDCGCGYCFSCHACENCLSDDDNARCLLLPDEPIECIIVPYETLSGDIRLEFGEQYE